MYKNIFMYLSLVRGSKLQTGIVLEAYGWRMNFGEHLA
jgi:hypothetical protein